jgi:transcription initiation factor IIE alpha subunit
MLFILSSFNISLSFSYSVVLTFDFQKFQEQAVLSLEALIELTDEDLKTELEITKIGHRRYLIHLTTTKND